jgi:hypothetical protein
MCLQRGISLFFIAWCSAFERLSVCRHLGSFNEAMTLDIDIHTMCIIVKTRPWWAMMTQNDVRFSIHQGER